MARLTKDSKVLAGRLTISRWSGGDDPRNISIRVIDDSSGVEFVSVAVTPEELTLALTGQGHIPCEYTVAGLHLIGKTSETKTELVPLRKRSRSEADMEAFRALEVDGWKGRESDLKNHHCWTEKGYRVVFHRHVGEGVLPDMKGKG